MIIKKQFVDNLNMLLSELLYNLEQNNCNYVLIKENNYYELHIDNVIYRFFQKTNMVSAIELNLLDSSPNYIDEQKITNRANKRYTKKDIKRENLKYKTKNAVKKYNY